jgi:hypothetical protein
MTTNRGRAAVVVASEAIHLAAAAFAWIAAALAQHMMTTAHAGATFSRSMSNSRGDARRHSRGGRRPRLAAVSPS